MRHRMLIVASLASAILLAGCDILEIDNWDPPNVLLTGNLVFEGKPVGVRVNGVQLQLWQVEPEYPLVNNIPVYVDQHGDYSVAVFNGTYEINLVSGNGPWANDPSRRRVVVNGDTSFDIPVQPYYTIQNETITYSASPGPGGAITATFNVGQHDTSRPVEWVGVYVNTTTFVDRSFALPIANSIRERSQAAIQANLNQNSPISVTVNLPADIHLTPGPDRRNHVFVRVGVKTVGVAEMLFSPVHKIAI